MSDLKSLESLRWWAKREMPYCTDVFKTVIDAIDKEVDDKYIPLPTCADGVIKLGDSIIRDDHCIGPIDAMSFEADGTWEVHHNGNGWAVRGDELHYVPESITLEDIVTNALQLGLSDTDKNLDVPETCDVICQSIRSLAENGDLWKGVDYD